MIHAGCLTIGTVVHNGGIAIQAGAAPVFRNIGGAVGSAIWSLRHVEIAGSWEDVDLWCVPVLQKRVGRPGQLIATLNVVSAPPSALEPRQIRIHLIALGCVIAGGVFVIGGVIVAGSLREGGSRGYGGSRIVGRANTAGLEVVDVAGGGEAEVVIVLERIAPSNRGHEAGRQGEIRTNVGGDVGGGIAEIVPKYIRWTRRALVIQARRRICKRQNLTALSLVLIEPGTKHAHLLRDRRV